jgi:hypothetical protein
MTTASAYFLLLMGYLQRNPTDISENCVYDFWKCCTTQFSQIGSILFFVVRHNLTGKLTLNLPQIRRQYSSVRCCLVLLLLCPAVHEICFYGFVFDYFYLKEVDKNKKSKTKMRILSKSLEPVSLEKKCKIGHTQARAPKSSTIFYYNPADDSENKPHCS